MFNARFALALSLCASTTACLEKEFVPNPDYCGRHDGDAYCGRVAPQTPFCVVSSQTCYDESSVELGKFGCAAEMPRAECREECGFDNESCVDPTTGTGSETGTTDPSGETETSSTTEDDVSSSTTGPECTEDIPCLDPAAPFCVDGTCSTCDLSVDPSPDDACAMLDEALPLCVGTACVQCSAEDTAACDGTTTPLCDAGTNTCVACQFHEECQDLGLPACNIATGACFSNDAVSMANAGSNGALQSAIDDVADGATHAILITGSGSVNHTVTVDGGKTIAIVSTNTSTQEVRGASGNPTVTVTGADTTVYLHRLALTANTNDVGVSVEAGGTLYADATRIAQNSGGGVTLASGTTGFLRNCMVGVGLNEVPAVLVSGGTLESVYTSILGGAFDSYGLRCTSGSADVRNTIITTRGDNDAMVCPGATTSNSRVENTAMTSWFIDYNGGDSHLDAAGQALFADVAVWEEGDPPFDFDGDPRPSVDGSPDFVGADAVP
jgi:hypothetical protein